MYINLYLFRSAMFPSSGEATVFLRHLVLLFCVDDCLVCRVHRITSAKCRKNTVVSPDDGHIVARNM
jgi:hypothetical protein